MSGCTSSTDAINQSERQPSSTRSNVITLQAARTTYENYLKVSGVVIADGGQGLDQLRPYVTERAFEKERDNYKALSAAKLHGSGRPNLAKFELQQADQSRSRLSAYACVDFTGLRILDSQGRDVTPKDRQSLQTNRPVFVWSDGQVKLEENSQWTGASICSS